MKTITAAFAQSNFHELLDESAHEPIQIVGERTNAVLISKEEWESIQETIYLLSIPGMRESIQEGLNTPVEECSMEMEW